MKAALVVPRLSGNPAANLDHIERMVVDAADAGAKLAVLPEAALTGLTNNDDPLHDLPLGEPVPGPATERLAACARQHRVWVASGLIEKDGDCLYDSAVLLAPDGSVALKYRRNQPQWHGSCADPAVYKQGEEVGVVETPFGRLGFLICGDLFDDEIVSRFRAREPEWLLFPFARCFSDGSANQDRWDRDELPEYARRVKVAGVPALMVNYIGDPEVEECPSFGGAFAISAEGELRASLPLGVEGTLTVDLSLMGHGSSLA